MCSATQPEMVRMLLCTLCDSLSQPLTRSRWDRVVLAAEKDFKGRIRRICTPYILDPLQLQLVQHSTNHAWQDRRA